MSVQKHFKWKRVIFYSALNFRFLIKQYNNKYSVFGKQTIVRLGNFYIFVIRMH